MTIWGNQSGRVSSAEVTASRNALPGISGRRFSSQLSPGAQDEESIDPVTKSESKSTAGDSGRLVEFDHHRRREGVKEAVDVSGGTAGYKALFTDIAVSFYQQNGQPAGNLRTVMPNTWLRRQLWGAEIKQDPPTVTYAEVMGSEDGVAKMTSLIMKFGLVFVEDTPFDDSIHTKKLLERIGPIRETHYGGFYDFVPDMAKADTAYTNIALAAHTDTTYFTDPVGLQAFHLLSHTPSSGEPDATGGESLLVDGFHAAKILRASRKGYFQELASRTLPWHASGNKGVTIAPEKMFPVLGLGRDGESVHKVRWNADDRGVLPLTNSNKQCTRGMLWYTAAAKWEEILRSNELEYWYQLKPGKTVIFDNHRVLHGRSAFTGLRRICGGYISMDDFVSRWRNTNLPRDEVLAQVIG
ncbi:putative trimethyllysine dioxygenase [Diaporthe ampelina]|uniref:Putative trimethyllysine dioxygenase n=1 Tax=Diaporthe ampelina TaxID=1214573 RepID=A0A0G2FZD6_9PEZI|nr:putative trimethyllysine dioxygenase [Diaporthe ampelina]